MKKIVLLSLLFAFMTSCGSKDKGELVGVKGKKWHPEKPYGMSLIPGGAFVMGKSDDDFTGIQDAPKWDLSLSVSIGHKNRHICHMKVSRVFTQHLSHVNIMNHL